MKREISQKVDTTICNLGSFGPFAVRGCGSTSALSRRIRSTTLGLILTLTATAMAGVHAQATAAVSASSLDEINPALLSEGADSSLMLGYTGEDVSVADATGNLISSAVDAKAIRPSDTRISQETIQHPMELDIDISQTVIPNQDHDALADTGTVVHHVRAGETITDISKKYKVSVAAIIKANSIDNPAALSANDVLRIPNKQVLAQATTAETIADIKGGDRLALKTTDVAVGALESQPSEAFRVSPDIEAPAIARRTILPQVTALDLPPLESSDTYLPNKTLQMPTGKFKYIWPAKGVFTSGYGPRWGRMHRGIDIAAPVGTTVVASAPGIVERAGWNSGGYGNLVEVRHPDGSFTRYAHNNKIVVKKGQPVRQGEKIAEMGSTGRSTGPHTHFEIRKPGKGAVNPMRYLRKRS